MDKAGRRQLLSIPAWRIETAQFLLKEYTIPLSASLTRLESLRKSSALLESCVMAPDQRQEI